MMVGATIGYGDLYEGYAKVAAAAFEKHTGLQVHVFGAKEIDIVAARADFPVTGSQHEKACVFKWWLFDLLPDADSIVYFDADYMTVSDWDPGVFKGSDKLVVVRDRTEMLKDLRYCHASDYLSYFNAGFYISNRQHHHQLFKDCRPVHNAIKRQFTDQCTVNHMVQKLGVPVHFLDRRFNCMEGGHLYRAFDIKAYHGRWVYPYYEEGKVPDVGNVAWHASAMLDLAGLYHVYTGTERFNLTLMYDGTTDSQWYWYATASGVPRFFHWTGLSEVSFDKVLCIG